MPAEHPEKPEGERMRETSGTLQTGEPCRRVISAGFLVLAAREERSTSLCEGLRPHAQQGRPRLPLLRDAYGGQAAAAASQGLFIRATAPRNRSFSRIPRGHAIFALTRAFCGEKIAAYVNAFGRPDDPMIRGRRPRLHQARLIRVHRCLSVVEPSRSCSETPHDPMVGPPERYFGYGGAAPGRFGPSVVKPTRVLRVCRKTKPLPGNGLVGPITHAFSGY